MDTSEAEIASLEERLVVLVRRLRVLQVQLAAYGALNVPPHIVIDKEECERELAQIRAQLRRLRPGSTERIPYLGLLTFQEANADFFFGRDALVAELAAQVGRAPFLAVLGPSGSGKSSVVRAGLIPLLKGGALAGSESWRYVTFKPGARPLDTLAAELVKLQSGDLGAALALRNQLSQGAQNGTPLLLAADMLLNRAVGQRLVLVVDQFEELWTLAPAEASALEAWVAQEQRPFIQLLLGATSQPAVVSQADPLKDMPVTVILTMRADFLHRAAENPMLARRIGEHDVIVGPMSDDELREAIVRPAELAGADFEPGLVDELVEHCVGRPGALPLLQHTLLELWKRRAADGAMTWDAYKEIDGLAGALEQQAEAIYTALSPDGQVICQQVLLDLIQPIEGATDTRRRAPLQDLVHHANTMSVVESVVQTLADARLVTTTGSSAMADQMVDLAHEALIDHWPRLRAWLDAERANLLASRRLGDDARRWDKHGRDTSYLYRGAALHEVRELAGSVELGDLEHAFVQAGVTAERAARRRLRSLQAAVAILGLIIICLLANSAINYIGNIEFSSRQQGRNEALQDFWEPPKGVTFVEPSKQVSFSDPVSVLVAANDGGAPPLYYLGTANVGIGRSEDGIHWTFSRLGLPEGPPADNDSNKTVRGITDLAVDPLDRRHVLASVLDHGIYLSRDGAQSWNAAQGLPDGEGVVALTLHGDWGLAVVRPSFRLYSSSDGGATWRPLNGDGLPAGQIYAVAIPPRAGMAYIGTDKGVYRSSLPASPGQRWRWEQVTRLPPSLLIVPGTQPDPAIYFVSTEHEGLWTIYQLSPDGQPILLGQVGDQPRALAPGARTIYALLNTGAVMILSPGQDAVQIAPGDGLSFDILMLSQSDGGAKLLLGNQNGLLTNRVLLAR